MSSVASHNSGTQDFGSRGTTFERLRFARQIVSEEAQALLRIADRLDNEFCRAVELLLNCQGSAVVTGIVLIVSACGIFAVVFYILGI